MNPAKTTSPIRLLGLLWVFAAFCASDSLAEPDENTAFATADIGLQVISNTNRTDFHTFWESGAGVEGYIATPFYLGDIQLGTRVISFDSKPADLTDYLSVFLYAGWGLSWDLPYNLKGFTGFSIGNDLMSFEAENRPGSQQESEFGMALAARLSAPLPGRWALTAGGSYSEIFTRNRIQLVFVSVGLSRTVDLPDWLTEFLK